MGATLPLHACVRAERERVRGYRPNLLTSFDDMMNVDMYMLAFAIARRVEPSITGVSFRGAMRPTSKGTQHER